MWAVLGPTAIVLFVLAMLARPGSVRSWGGERPATPATTERVP
jgi:hypothetical protein